MDRLCHSCQGMLGLINTENIEHKKHIVHLDFKRWSGNALADSCHLCTLLFYAAAGPNHQTFIDSYMAPTYKLSGRRMGSMKIRDIYDEGNCKYLALIESLKQDSEKVRLRKKLERSIGHFTMTPNTVQQVIQWMRLCSKQHDACQQYQRLAGAENGLPLRLIDVDPNGEYLRDYEPGMTEFEFLSCENATNVCIRHSEEATLGGPEQIRYLTLSHRWGNTIPAKLNWDNMAEFSAQLPIQSLSKTFKDAILMTRCLGFRYIWIDSICINQVDIAEKASEIGRMQSIYKNSQLNLSAISGESGLIFSRNPKSVLGPVLQKMTNSDVQTTEADEDCLMISAGPWETFIDLGSLNERAWVVQERLLAPRVLHCCYNMVYWECPCLRSSEVDPLGEMDHNTVTSRPDLRTNIKRDFATASMARHIELYDTSSPMGRLNPFHRIVRSYFFAKQLTYPHDRLLAISGIAKWFMKTLKLTPESYLAGLWQEALPESLLWHFFKYPKGTWSAVRDLHAGPSWSWASIVSNGVIILGMMSFKLHDPQPLFQNLQATIVPRSGDRFGQLETAILRLQAVIIPIEREWRNDAPHIHFPGETTWYPESQDPWSAKPITMREKIRGIILEKILYLSSPIEKNRFSKDLVRFFRKRATRSYIEVRWDTTDMLWTEKTSYSPRQLYIIPIAWDCGKGSLGEPGTRNIVIRGLILQRLPGQGQYARVGMFMTANYDVYQNSGLSRGILRRMPKKALESFSIRNARPPSLWKRVSQTVFHLFRLRLEKEGTNTMQTCLNPDDHLGISDNELHNIEIL